MKHRGYDSKILTIYLGTDADDEKLLNELTHQGWRVVGISLYGPTHTRIYLERPARA